MATWEESATVAYKRWREPDDGRGADFAGHLDEDFAADNEICTVTAATRPQGTITLDEALDAIGFGSFQWKMFFLTGLSWIADAMEMMILSVLGPQLHCEWRLEGYQVAAITSVVFCGMGISSPLWGKLTDKFGRKMGLTLAMSWSFLYSLLTAIAPRYGWLLFLRFLVGVGIGGAPQSVTLYSEFLPSKVRGMSIMLFGVFWAIGALLQVLLALWIMPVLGWRWLLGLSASPMALFLCLSYWLPESPRFDMLMGRREKALKTLANMAKDNGKEMPEGHIVSFKLNQRGQILALFKPQYLRTTLLLWYIWFTIAFSYYGIILLTTEMFQSGDSCGATQGSKNDPSCMMECKYLTADDYKDLIWTTLGEFPGLIIVLVVVDCLGRKKSLTLCFFMFSLFTLSMLGCIGRTGLTIFIFIARAFITGGYQVAYVYTPEVFPTEARAIGLGTCSMLGRLGALITPFVAQVLLRSSVTLTVLVYCGFSLVAGVASLLLPIETLGRTLQETVPNPELAEARRRSKSETEPSGMKDSQQ
ncbi:synaptic vesicle 2-related protein-like [Synchiropus splendidus]|uniref:synaptic vesicle 2-related protein-like n=1 Tax=Synchiropus splendidus TaxID=270530 RepID=UPI00237D6F4F|nr:synaptic vesicle 2-related protein-like [Synchiropus splendidus]